jgi:energy-coupling factor transport system permease protein
MAIGIGQRFGRYVAIESRLHALDPPAKILIFAVVLASAISASTWPAIGLVCAYLVLLCALSRVGPSFYVGSLKYFAWMFALSFALNAVFPREGAGVPLGRTALEMGAIFAARLALMILAAAVFTVVTSPSEIGDGIMAFANSKGRVGRRAAEFAALVAMSLRFVPVIFEEAERIRAAQRLRGGKRRGLLGRAKSVVELIVPLVESSLRRANNLGYALEARCYGYHAPAGRPARIGIPEAVFLAASVGVLLVTVIGR